MKKSILYIAALLLAAAPLTSCDDDKAMPPMPIPGEDLVIPQANTTILELKEAFVKNGSRDYNTIVGTKEDGSDYIIKGKVVSSDEEGNIYKNLMIEDETAGLTVSVDQTKLYQSYKIGQEVTINCTGLYMGAYGYCMNLGYEPQTGKSNPGRIPEDIFAAHAYAYGIPANVEPQVLTIEEIAPLQSKPASPEAMALMSRYVEFEDLEFENAGEPLAVQGGSTSRYAVDAEGNRLQLYNSGYSSIWANVLPSGKGNVSGILSFYNREWQLLIISMDSFQDFTGGFVAVETIFSESFASESKDFTIENINLGGQDYVWSFDSRYSCMKASGFVGSNHNTSSRLISPEIDLSGYATARASYDQACNFFSSLETAKKEAAFEVSVDGGEWTTLEVPSFTDYASWNFKSSGNIDLSAYVGKKIRLAFHYSSTSAKAGTWEVKNFKVSGTK